MTAIKYPKNQDLRELVRFSCETGHIWLAESRMLMLHASAMALLRRELIQQVGPELARNLLTRVGYQSGMNDAEIARKIRGSANPQDAFVVGPQLHMLEGSVKVIPVRMAFDQAAGQFDGEFLWEGSWEADAHVRDFGHTDDPMCWMQIGYASGYTSAFMGQFILFKEVECAAAGRSHCRIVGKPLAEWEDAEDYRHFFAQDSIQTQLQALQHQVEVLRRSAQHPPCDGMIGSATNFRHACHLIHRAAASAVTVLLQGETGVGKERFARLLHKQSPRREQPFIAVNCAAIPENLIESELFGVEKGAYTGAQHTRMGRFERADGGTLFLDEIGELPLAAQAKLLRVLQEGEIERLGDQKVRKINVRLVAASHVDLKQAVADGRFRADLYYRIHVYPVVIPPLRERRSDIPLLAEAIIERLTALHEKPVCGITDKALRALQAQAWPGNVRELENTLELGLILADPGGAIELNHLFPLHSEPDHTGLDRQGNLQADSHTSRAALYEQMLASGLNFDDIERGFLDHAVRKADGNLSRAARMLGMTRPQLAYRLKKTLSQASTVS
ncbi:MAG: hypothetical protein RI925_1134 [Pseudomonadota bacterium]|jgi:DNA-binding NtrC family response regulator